MERRLVGPWLRLVAGKEALLERVGRVPQATREERPRTGGWSRMDVVEHLVLVEGGIGTALAKAPTPDRPRAFPRARWFRFIGLRVALKGGLRIKAPTEAILPTREHPWHVLLSRWEEQRRNLEEWLLGVDPAILRTPRFRHPIAGWLDVPQALTFTADHLDHHLAQVGRIESASG